jgi:hypothetical protein
VSGGPVRCSARTPVHPSRSLVAGWTAAMSSRTSGPIGLPAPCVRAGTIVPLRASPVATNPNRWLTLGHVGWSATGDLVSHPDGAAQQPAHASGPSPTLPCNKAPARRECHATQGKARLRRTPIGYADRPPPAGDVLMSLPPLTRSARTFRGSALTHPAAAAPSAPAASPALPAVGPLAPSSSGWGRGRHPDRPGPRPPPRTAPAAPPAPRPAGGRRPVRESPGRPPSCGGY